MTADGFTEAIHTHFYTTGNALIALKKKGLVIKNDRVYVITEKGRQVLPVLKQIVELDNEIDKLLSTIDV